jgi:hypothetical protein
LHDAAAAFGYLTASAPDMETAPDKESLLVTAAKAVGHAAGSVASLVGVKGNSEARKEASANGRLPKKHKHRLPRKLKKEMKAKEMKAEEMQPKEAQGAV